MSPAAYLELTVVWSRFNIIKFNAVYILFKDRYIWSMTILHDYLNTPYLKH